MVEGQPLHYSQDLPVRTEFFGDFSYFGRFETYYPTMEMTEDLILPSSPNSIQSDSDNSISSVEISPKAISSKKNVKSEEKSVQCCWRSCGIFFPSLDQLASHVSKVHASGGPGGLFYCGWEGCSRNNKGFNARYKMLVHVRTHTNEKPHKCFQCEKSFSRAENLKIHSRSHSGEKPYACPVPGCNKAYSNSSDRFKHTRTHQVEKPYQCKVSGCPKRYTDPSSLRKHVKTFKHFVNENNENAKSVISHIEDEAMKNTEPKPDIWRIDDQSIDKSTVYPENVEKSCGCTHSIRCVSSNCVEKSADILRLEALIKLKNEEPIIWNRFPFLSETKNSYNPYISEESMSVDMPLDLSIHRKDI